MSVLIQEAYDKYTETPLQGSDWHLIKYMYMYHLELSDVLGYDNSSVLILP